MGYYINSTSKGKHLGFSAKTKEQALIQDGATPTDGKTFEDNLVCIVDNGHFAAAAYAYSKEEYEDFINPRDTRPKTWLIYEHAKELSGYKERMS